MCGKSTFYLLIVDGSLDDTDTVDGSEIWRSPVEVGSLSSHYFYKVYMNI